MVLNNLFLKAENKKQEIIKRQYISHKLLFQITIRTSTITRTILFLLHSKRLAN